MSGTAERLNRREFLVRTGVSLSVASGAMLLATPAFAQPAPPAQGPVGGEEMTSDSYKPVVRPAKPGATSLMTVKEVEVMERTLACPCPCTLDVYTCRTTDFACGISPAVHGDIKRLVEGGYSAAEIMRAMTDTYGDFILLTPRKQGFNLLAWFAPFAALGLGAVGIGALLRSWRRNAMQAAVVEAQREQASPFASELEATPDELDRLQAALRDER